MSSDRNKIAQELTIEQLDQFVAELAKLPGKQRTLAAIQHKAAELGITISLMSARAFRETTFEKHLQNLRRAQQIAGEVEAIEQGGNTLADASAKLLSKRIFNQLLEAEDEDVGGEVDLEKMSLALSRIRTGDVARAALEQKLRDAERREKDREEKNRLAAEQLQKLRDPGATLNSDEREAILSTVDDLLGIRPPKPPARSE